MAAEETNDTQDEQHQKGGSRSRMMVIVGSIVVLEAALILGVVMFFIGPLSADASQTPDEKIVPEEERIVETLILDAKLPNNRTGVTYLYDTEVYVQTRRRNVEMVQQELDQFQNEIRAEIAAIWRTAEPHHFQEPRLENLTRKVSALLERRFGTDAQTGKPIAEKCVIVMGTGFRIDS